MRYLQYILLSITLLLMALPSHAQYLGGIGDGHGSDGGTFELGCTIPALEREALEKIYVALNGDEWFDKSNWLVGSDESEWYGVTIENCHVVALNLSSNNLEGSLPPEIVNLFELKELWMDDNKISGGLQYVPILEAMRVVNLSYNKFFTNIPPEFGSMSGLEELYLADNHLQGSIPPEFENLYSIRIIDLSENELTGTVPAELATLNTLTTLDLSENSLSGDMPAAIANLANDALTYADFSHNQFTGMIAFPGSNVLWDISYNYLDFGDLEPIVATVDLSNLNYAPQLDIPPGGLITFTVGSILTLTFSTPGTANHYQWIHNGSNVGGDNVTYTQSSAATSDAGLYRLSISNDLVPGLDLLTEPYIVSTDGCDGIDRETGNIDLSFDAQIEVPDGDFVFMQGNKILTSFHNNNVGTTEVDGVYRFDQNGILDPTFSIPGVTPRREGFIVLPDNSLLVGEESGTFAYVRKRTAEGAIDPSLNSSSHEWYDGHIRSMAVQSTGDIIVCHDISGEYEYIERIKPNGDLDPTFNKFLDFQANVMRVQPDDKVIVGGYHVYGFGPDIEPGFYRLNADGQVDATFVGYISDPDGEILDIAIQPDGKIIVAGWFNSFNGEDALSIVRLNPSGTIDHTFMANTPGITIPPAFNHYISNVEVQSDGKILITGSFMYINGSPRNSVARLNANGTLDCEFNVLDGPMGLYEVSGIAIQPDNKILLSGVFYDWENVERNGLVRIFGDESSGLIIDLQPSNATACAGGSATFTTNAVGDPNINYTWQFSPDGIAPFTFVPENNESGTIVLTNVTEAREGFYRCEIGGIEDDEIYTTVVKLTVVTVTPPGAVDVSSCGSGIVILTATGGGPGEYRWFTSATGTAISGETNASYTTPTLSSTTTFYVALNDGTCESVKTDVDAIINSSVPASPAATNGFTCGPGTVALNASGSTNGNYRWYTSSTGGTAIPGEVNGSFTTPSLSSTTTYYATIVDGACESASRTAITATVETPPSAPGVTGASSCGNASLVLQASGAVNGEYRWYTSSSGSTMIVGEVNDTFTTPMISSTTNYYVTIHNGVCESTPRVAVTATINSPSSPPGATGASRCGSGTVILTASGGANGNYRWYTVPTGGTALTGEVNATFMTPSIASTQTYYVSIDAGCESTRTSVVATIDTMPSSPSTTAASRCGSGTVTLTATGASDGAYRWYTTATGGTGIAGEVNAVYETPSLTTTTSYFVSVVNGTCETPRVEAVATIMSIPAPPGTTGASAIAPASVTLMATGGVNGQYRWYTSPTGGTPIANEVNATYVTPVLSATTTYHVAINNGDCESSRTAVTAQLLPNQPPVIQVPPAEAVIQGFVTLPLTTYISDPNDNLDLSTLQITQQPISGASASIDAQHNLVLDYGGVDFSGTDVLEISVCDLVGACSTQKIEIEVMGDIVVFNAISPNGDDKNPVFYIQYINNLPQTKENKVSVFNRWGTPVFEISNYDNVNRVFNGIGSNGELLPSGTYYYRIDFASGIPSRTGYLQINH